MKSSFKPTRLPYYSEGGAKFVQEVARAVQSGQPHIIRASEQNIITARLKWYNGARYLRDTFPKRYKDLGVDSIIVKKYEDCLIFMSSYSTTLLSLIQHIDSFFSGKLLKDGDVFEAEDIDLPTQEWNRVRTYLKDRACTYDIDETTGRIIIIYNENTRTTTDAEPGQTK